MGFNLTSKILSLVYPNKRFSLREVSRFGARLIVYIDQHTGRKIALNVFEKSETEFFLRFVQKDHVCLDIGSNIGYFTVLFASNGAKVHSFDPVLENYVLQELTCALNPGFDVELHNCAVGDSSGYISLSIPQQTSLTRIVGNEDPADEDARTVEMITVDQLKLPKVDVIKIDVEGAEEMVINGMQQTIQRCKPKIIMIELVEEHLVAFDSSIQKVFDVLKGQRFIPMLLKSGELISYVGDRAVNDNYFFVQR